MQSLAKIPKQNMLRCIADPCIATNVVEEITITRLVEIVALPICPICEKYITNMGCGAPKPLQDCPFERK